MKQLYTIIISLFVVFPLYSQTFERIEQDAGFGVLLNNQGVATADYDNDGDLDVFIVAKNDFASIQPNTWSRLMQNNNDGTFTDVTIEAGFDNLYNFDEDDPGWKYGVKMGASFGDYDNDGFADLLLTNYKRIQLFHNKGDGTFEEVTATAGLPTVESCYFTTALWWDFNKDSHLDLYVSKWGECSKNLYFENNGDGTFADKTAQLGVGGTDNRKTWMAVPLDVNNDNRWDIYIANDFTANELFVQNADGTFTESAMAYGLAATGNDMGITVSDYNNDGDFDIFITNIDENRLFIPNGISYSNVASIKGVYHSYWAWGTQFADFDLDGDEDLFVANGYQNDFIDFPTLKTNFLYQNQTVEGQDTFLDVSAAANVNAFSNSMSINVFDYDVDGDLDLFVTNMDDAPFFYENKTNTNNATPKSWVSFLFEGTISNKNGLGNRVTIWTDGTAQQRLYTGASLHSQSLQGIHFGLGNATIIDSVEVRWDLGLVEKYYNLPLNQYIALREGDNYQVLNLQNQKIFGCNDPASCNYNPNATVNDGSCSYLPAPQINGNLNAGYFNIQTYTCEENAGSTYFWKIQDGEIVDGQGTATVKVLWHLADSGHVSVKEINSCYSEMATIDVDLSYDNMDAKHSIARLWNEALLFSIRRDFARPTVHARNLFHTSVAMYDAWAIYDDVARTYLIGKNIDGFSSSFDGFTPNIDLAEARQQTISYAMYRLLNHRFSTSPAYPKARLLYNDLMGELGYDISNTSTDYSTGDAAALGNFIAETIIDFGLQDGATELQGYANAYYEPVNNAMVTNQVGTNGLTDPNRWQPLSFETFIDQSGNLIEGSTPDFLSPEWGNVTPFSLGETEKSTHERDGNTYYVFYEPNHPPYLDTTAATNESHLYKWNFSLVSIWASHLTPNDSVMWDISPASIGNIDFTDFPTDNANFPDFYNTLDGGDIGQGWDINPITELPYEPQIVPRGDYARVLAEFWADGPDSETPPGHWFTILNTVNDHPQLDKRLNGKGPVLSVLEWDVKSYFILGGTMHDAAIAAWSVKGWFDFIRPISAIRYMAERGQSSDPNLPNYDVAGIELIDGLIELVEPEDELAGINGQHVGKIKLYTWRGHRYIPDPAVDAAGVGWILAEDWMPYQRISFVTPPFAGFVSGHSTYSRAAAEAMTLLTGDAYFPGGVGEFIAYKNEFLVFEEGPSVDVILQWATYRDASDQCSLSRIWGGIHPPADDIPGRIMGEQIGRKAYQFAVPYFYSEEDTQDGIPSIVYPNPAQATDVISISNTTPDMIFNVFDMQGRVVAIESTTFSNRFNNTVIRLKNPTKGMYIITSGNRSWKLLIM